MRLCLPFACTCPRLSREGKLVSPSLSCGRACGRSPPGWLSGVLTPPMQLACGQGRWPALPRAPSLDAALALGAQSFQRLLLRRVRPSARGVHLGEHRLHSASKEGDGMHAGEQVLEFLGEDRREVRDEVAHVVVREGRVEQARPVEAEDAERALEEGGVAVHQDQIPEPHGHVKRQGPREKREAPVEEVELRARPRPVKASVDLWQVDKHECGVQVEHPMQHCGRERVHGAQQRPRL
mmetsp:Transcript_24072/g.75021  ORF Transcript_24072/g.75021 Transcript_24072/m.75021 type:complete len:238 (+) Transcript_24072:617-1330(+)